MMYAITPLINNNYYKPYLNNNMNNMNNIYLLSNPDLYLCSSIILETTATICLRQVNINKLWYIPSYIGYAISFYLFPKSLVKYQLSRAYQLWCGFGIILTTIFDKILFNNIITFKKIVGIFIMIFGIVLTK